MAETPRITLAMLKGACREQRAIFRKEWPEGVEVTLENVRRAQEIGLPLEWSKRWFTPEAGKAYDEATAPASKAYDEAIATASKTYHEAIATARKAYFEATALAAKAYHEAIAPAWFLAFLDSQKEARNEIHLFG